MGGSGWGHKRYLFNPSLTVTSIQEVNGHVEGHLIEWTEFIWLVHHGCVGWNLLEDVDGHVEVVILHRRRWINWRKRRPVCASVSDFYLLNSNSNNFQLFSIILYPGRWVEQSKRQPVNCQEISKCLFVIWGICCFSKNRESCSISHISRSHSIKCCPMSYPMSIMNLLLKPLWSRSWHKAPMNIARLYVQ